MSDMHFDPARPGGNPWNPGGLGQPGVIPLRPLELGDLYRGAIATISRYPGLVFGSAAIVGFVHLIVSYLTWSGPPADLMSAATDPAAGSLGSLLGTVVLMLGSIWLTGVFTVVISRAVLGRPLTFAEMSRELSPKLPGLIVVSLVVTVLTTIGLVLCVLPGVWVAVLLSMAGPALVLEGLGVGAALRRSKELLDGQWWRVFGILLLTGVIGAIASLVVSIPAVFASGALASVILGAIPIVLITPFSSLVLVLVYVDLRMRRENLHFELARSAGIVPPHP